MFIDQTSSRADLLAAVAQEPALEAHLLAIGMAGEEVSDADLYAAIQAWIEEGDETAF